MSIPSSTHSNLSRAPVAPPTHLQPTIYLSEPGVATKLAGQVGAGGDSLDMLSVALKIKVDTFRNIKVGGMCEDPPIILYFGIFLCFL